MNTVLSEEELEQSYYHVNNRCWSSESNTDDYFLNYDTLDSKDSYFFDEPIDSEVCEEVEGVGKVLDVPCGPIGSVSPREALYICSSTGRQLDMFLTIKTD